MAAAGGGGRVVVVLVGRVVGASGGALRPTVALGTATGLGAPWMPPGIRDEGNDRVPFSTGGLGAEGTKAGLVDIEAAGGPTRPTGLGEGRSAGAGGGAEGTGLGAGISSFR
jgi:hypothetical protein